MDRRDSRVKQKGEKQMENKKEKLTAGDLKNVSGGWCIDDHKCPCCGYDWTPLLHEGEYYQLQCPSCLCRFLIFTDGNHLRAQDL